MSMSYYNMYKKLINAGRTEGIEEKLASLLGFNKLTTEEYEDLMGMLNTKDN